MQTIRLGKTNVQIPKLGMGTWAIGGGPAWGDRDEKECVDTIHKAIELGVNLLDTAPAYNFGNSEKVVGKALEKIGRESVYVITKCGIVWDREGSLFNKIGDVQLYKNLSKESIKLEIEESLERLGIEYVDVYMTHWQSVEPYHTQVSETMEIMNNLKTKGKIKAIGAANLSREHIEEYLNYGELDIVQGKYSILDRQAEEELLPFCRENGITFQAYSPLEQGLLSGYYTREYRPKGAQANKKWFQPEAMQKVMDMLEKWEPLCKKYGCSIANLALAWVMAQGDYITVLNGCSKVSQIEENSKAIQIDLSKDDVKWMRSLANEIL
ncbi:NADH-dependent methylglyoxal reductase [Clostridium sp. C105KSO13]|uniref:NADH-dependent methylglyoxal reductase n=1 Tax=Clostridium sp. C105KSO13 TaxID=1776045 RepID=UPI0007407CB0|nr:aldo/keto reductase [Clostridium sp. C105KSO13]CUX38397.1 General stress protein 69 [Clostridium sp. C105KSO13]